MAKKQTLDDTNNMNFFGAMEKIESSLLNAHVNFLFGEINNTSVQDIVKWILYENLQTEETKTLVLHINSYGGSLTDAFALIDVMRHSSYPICTIGIGAVHSAAFMIFASGTKGMRAIGKNSSIMCHQYSDEMIGKYHDLKCQVREMDSLNQRMISILQDCTGLESKVIKNKLLPPSDVWLSPEELLKYNIADQIF